MLRGRVKVQLLDRVELAVELQDERFAEAQLDRVTRVGNLVEAISRADLDTVRSGLRLLGENIDADLT